MEISHSIKRIKSALIACMMLLSFIQVLPASAKCTLAAIQQAAMTVNTSKIDGCIYYVKNRNQVLRKDLRTGKITKLHFNQEPYCITAIKLSPNKQFLLVFVDTGACGSGGVSDGVELHRYNLRQHRMRLLFKGFKIVRYKSGYYAKTAWRILNPNAACEADYVYTWKDYLLDGNGNLLKQSKEYQ